MKTIKTIMVNTHSRDCHDFTFKLEDGKEVDHQGYNPGVLGGVGDDDLYFEVDNATGQILDWVPIKFDELDLDEEDEDKDEEPEDDIDWDNWKPAT